MIEPRIIPVLLLSDGRVVKTAGFRPWHYVGDPVNAVSQFSDMGADEILILDIGAGRDRTPIPFSLLADMAEETSVPLAYGGGLRTLEDVSAVIRSGFEKVVLTSAAVSNPDLLSTVAAIFGNQCVIGGLDVRRQGETHMVCIDGGTKPVKDLDPAQHAQAMVERGAGEILVHSIDREGSGTGYDIEVTRAVSAAVSVPVIACGGAACVDDLRRVVHEGGASAAAAGSLFVFRSHTQGVNLHLPGRIFAPGGDSTGGWR